MPTKVYMMEYERGWGSRVDEVKEFDTREEALVYAKEYNETYNTEDTVPDWYIVAQVESEY